MTKRNPKIEEANDEIKKLEAAGEIVPDAKDGADDVGAEIGQDDDVEVDAVSPAVEHEATVLDAFLAWAQSDEDTDTASFKESGLLDAKGALTAEGVRVLDAEKIGWRTIYFLRLGIPLTLKDGTKLMDGSSIMIANGGRDEAQQSSFWVCVYHEKAAPITVYQNRLHQFWDAKYPLTQKIGAKYTKVS